MSRQPAKSEDEQFVQVSAPLCAHDGEKFVRQLDDWVKSLPRALKNEFRAISKNADDNKISFGQRLALNSVPGIAAWMNFWADKKSVSTPLWINLIDQIDISLLPVVIGSLGCNKELNCVLDRCAQRLPITTANQKVTLPCWALMLRRAEKASNYDAIIWAGTVANGVTDLVRVEAVGWASLRVRNTSLNSPQIEPPEALDVAGAIIRHRAQPWSALQEEFKELKRLSILDKTGLMALALMDHVNLDGPNRAAIWVELVCGLNAADHVLRLAMTNVSAHELFEQLMIANRFGVADKLAGYCSAEYVSSLVQKHMLHVYPGLTAAMEKTNMSDSLGLDGSLAQHNRRIVKL